MSASPVSTTHASAHPKPFTMGLDVWQAEYSLHGGDLSGDTASATVPLELFLDEALELEVEEEDVGAVGAQIVNTVLVLVSVARAHRHH